MLSALRAYSCVRRIFPEFSKAYTRRNPSSFCVEKLTFFNNNMLLGLPASQIGASIRLTVQPLASDHVLPSTQVRGFFSS
jgi:hypothetical protein